LVLVMLVLNRGVSCVGAISPSTLKRFESEWSAESSRELDVMSVLLKSIFGIVCMLMDCSRRSEINNVCCVFEGWGGENDGNWGVEDKQTSHPRSRKYLCLNTTGNNVE